jgi:integrase/recombinase XerD
MTNFIELTPVPSDRPMPVADPLRLAVAAYLARFKGSSREHTESDLRCIVIDGVLEHSPAEHVRRPSVPAESPTLGFTHLQFEALLTAARQSAHPCDFALVAMLALLGLRISKRPARTSPTSAKSTATACCACAERAPRSSWSHCHQPSAGPSTRRSAPVWTAPILLNSRGSRMDRHAATRRLRRLAETSGVRIISPHPHMLRHTFVTTMLDAEVDLRDAQIAARHADPRTTMRYDRARKNLDRHPNYILAAYMASGT